MSSMHAEIRTYFNNSGAMSLHNATFQKYEPTQIPSNKFSRDQNFCMIKMVQTTQNYFTGMVKMLHRVRRELSSSEESDPWKALCFEVIDTLAK